ncbi:MAG TPA: phosphoadenosine phosphosulfate reductase family protein [Trueperaceae bacterium]
MKPLTLFDSERLTLPEALDLTAESLRAYGGQYRHWAIAFSGGKDSSATVAAVVYLIRSGRIGAPESLTVLYADTRQELPPLHASAMAMLDRLKAQGIRTRVVLPPMDKRFMVYMFGRGVPPPNNGTLRWCTRQIKVDPMLAALQELREASGEKFLMLTGVRIGESAARDQRIAISCSRDGAECGQGWFQEMTGDAISDTLAPILHWRVCHVWDWLMGFGPDHGLPTEDVAAAYGGEEAEEKNARTGCIGCPLATKDVALDLLLDLPAWAYLAPLKRLRPLYRELRLPHNRLRKHGEHLKDGSLAKNPNRMGPLTMAARRHGLETVLRIQAEVSEAARRQGRPPVSLINSEEHARILELIAANTWPERWTGAEPRGDEAFVPVLEQELGSQYLFATEGED